MTSVCKVSSDKDTLFEFNMSRDEVSGNSSTTRSDDVKVGDRSSLWDEVNGLTGLSSVMNGLRVVSKKVLWNDCRRPRPLEAGIKGLEKEDVVIDVVKGNEGEEEAV